MKKEINFKNKYFIIFAFIFVVAFGLYFFQFNLSGNAVLELDADYHEGENLDGILKLSLNNGEFIPASSIVVFETSEEQYEFPLEDVLSEQPIKGTYYIQGQNISGQGMGYGLIGSKKTYPEISFEFNVYSKSNETEVVVEAETETTDNVGEAGTQVVEEEQVEAGTETTEVTTESEPTEEVTEVVVEAETETTEVTEGVTAEPETIEVAEEVAEEQVVEVGTEVVEEEKTESVNEPVESSEESELSSESSEELSIIEEVAGAIAETVSNLFLGLTGTGKVSMDFEEEIKGETSADKPFVYNLEKSQTAELVPGSVTINSMVLSDDDIQFEVSDDSILVSTNYFESEEGFGADYLEDDFQTFEINLSAIGLNFSKGDLSIKFIYEGNEVLSLPIVLQGGKIEERNKSILIVPEFVLQNLTDDEKQILIQKFGNVSIKTTRAEVLDGRLIRNYKIGDYELVASYDYDLNMTDSLKKQMEKDKLNFLRDLIKMISEEENGSENVLEFFGSSDF